MLPTLKNVKSHKQTDTINVSLRTTLGMKEFNKFKEKSRQKTYLLNLASLLRTNKAS